MFKTRMLVVWANESSVNRKREIHLSTGEVYIKPSEIHGICELQFPPSENFGDWKDQEVQNWISKEIEKGNLIYPFKILMNNGAVFYNVLLTFEELNALLKLIEQGAS